MCDIPGTEKGCGSQPQKLLFFTRSFSVNLILVKWVRITVYAIRERTWGNFAGFRRLSVPGEQIFHISRLFLYEFESLFFFFWKVRNNNNMKHLRTPCGSVLVWSFYGDWPKKTEQLQRLSSSKVQTNFCCGSDIPLLPGPMFSNLAAPGSLNRRLSEHSLGPCWALRGSCKGRVLPSWLQVNCVGKNSV